MSTLSRRDRHGITLSELLIATIIVSIMMMGIFATMHAMQSMDRSITGDTSLSLRNTAVAAWIRHDAAASVGNSNDPGVSINTAGNYTCFRVNDLGTVDPADDTWNCYSLFNTVDLYRCSYTGTPAACVAATSTKIGTIAGAAGEGWDLANPAFGANGFSMTIVNRQTPAAAKSSINPEVTTSISVHPEGHSF